MEEFRALIEKLPIVQFLPPDVGEEISLSSLRPGESFGEMGLLDETTSKATVRASNDVEVLRLDKSVFKTLVHRNPEIRKYFELQTKHRSLHNFFRLYSPFAKLPVDSLEVMLTEMEVLYDFLTKLYESKIARTT